MLKHPGCYGPIQEKPGSIELETVGQLTALVSGSEKAWEAFADRYVAPLLAYARRLVRDSNVYPDLVQDTFIRWMTRYQTLDPETPIFPYLVTICRNLWLDNLKRSSRDFTSTGDLSPASSQETDVERECLRSIFQRDFSHCLQRVPQEHRKLLALSIEQWTIRELEQLTGTARSTINDAVLRAKKAIKKCLAELGWTEDEARALQ